MTYVPTYHDRQILEITFDLGEHTIMTADSETGEGWGIPVVLDRPRISAAFCISSSPYNAVRIEGGIDGMLTDFGNPDPHVIMISMSEDLPALSGPVVRLCDSYSAFTECAYRIVSRNALLILIPPNIQRLVERFRRNREQFCEATHSMVLALQSEGMN